MGQMYGHHLWQDFTECGSSFKLAGRHQDKSTGCKARSGGTSLERFGALLLNFNFVLDRHMTLVPLARNLGHFALWNADSSLDQ